MDKRFMKEKGMIYLVCLSIYFSVITLAQSQTSNDFYHQRLEFIENKGQLLDFNGSQRADILFSSVSGGVNIYLKQSGISYVLRKSEEIIEKNKIGERANSRTLNSIDSAQKAKILLQRVDVDFLSCNKNVEITGEDLVDGKSNYYFPQCPKGLIGLNSFKKVIYHNVYENIDVSFYSGINEGMEYDFTIKPGGDPENVQLKYSGEDSLRISQEGKLSIVTRLGEIKEFIPSTYQVVNGKKVAIPSSYSLEKNIIRIRLGAYDKTKSLIIDPWTTWITYDGGNSTDAGTAIATDRSGNVVSTGYTLSLNFPVFAGFQMVNGGGNTYGDVYITKFNSVGTRLWSTYYGGNGDDIGYGITTDGNSNVIITGSTGSSNLPVLSGYQMTSPGGTDAFVAKFNGSGNLIWATYFGGASAMDFGNSVAVNAQNNIFITGQTDSWDFPVLSGFQMTYNSPTDAFISQFNSSGALIWSTFYGGSGRDAGLGIATDNNGNIFMCGNTGSSNFPVQNGFQMIYGGATRDAFVVKCNGLGTPQWSTFLGGNGDEYANSVAIDLSNNALITGWTTSSNFPVLSGFQMTSNGKDVFVSKLNNNGSLLWSTYFGGSNPEEGYGIAADPLSGDCFISGDTYSTDFPVTGGACQLGFAGSEDNFLLSFDSVGNRLCATYMGGSGLMNDEGGGIALFGCFAYLTGYTPGPYPVTSGSYQTVYGGGNDDAFIAQLPKNCACSPPTNCSDVTSLNLAPQIEEENISVFPNPSTGVYNINCSVEFKMVTIKDILGNEIYKNKDGIKIIDLSSFPQGIYFLTIKTAKGIEVKKVVRD